MILWINLVTNGLPALALGVDPPDPTQMREPPRQAHRRASSARATGSAWRSSASWMGGAAMICYLVPARRAPEPHAMMHARAIAFSLLALSPLLPRLQLPLGDGVLPHAAPHPSRSPWSAPSS